jgi:hypothetical protein
VDLLECSACEQRFIVAEGGDDQHWSCPTCRRALGLVVRELPGSSHQIAAALNARTLDPGSQVAPELNGRGRKRERRRYERQAERRTWEYLSESATRSPETRP